MLLVIYVFSSRKFEGANQNKVEIVMRTRENNRVGGFSKLHC